MTTTDVPAPEADTHVVERRAPEPARRLMERLSPPMPADRLWGWLGPLAVTLLAGALRFHRLGSPRAFVFDETYYAKDAYSLLRFGYEQETVRRANARILNGKTDIFTGEPSFIVHPPFGKWLIGAGEALFELAPFGWRFAVALFGTISVLLMARIVRRMTRSTLLGCTAGLLLALDGLHFVASRTALLDGLLMFWVLAAFGCLVVDRDRSRSRLAARVSSTSDGARGPGSSAGLRPWRFAAGVCLGLACATKWSGLFYVAAFGVLAVAWDAGARRAVGVRHPLLGALRRDALPGFGSLVVTSVVVYTASWAGWLASSGGYDRTWAQNRDTAWPWIPDALRSLWHYHAGMRQFHVDLRDDHAYESNPWGWPLLARPVSFFYESPKRGDQGCTVDTCSREVLALGTPALWWAAIPALLLMLWLWTARRDWRAGAALAGVAAGWLPWFFFAERTIFSFYSVVFAPFVVLAITLALATVLGARDASARRRTWGAAIAGGYVLLAVANFAYIYPILAAEVIPLGDWQERMWFPSWI